MDPPSDRDIERLREIARRVGELAKGRPEVVERLQQAWAEYVALHLAHMKEREEKALAQRKFAIGILEQGFLEEQPRKEYEPSWDWEIFRVRVPARLRIEANAAKTPTARAKVDKKVAKAILKYIEDEDQIVGCADLVKRAELFNRRQAATPDGEYEQRSFTVGFRPRPEFKMGPHPLFCSWRDFQEFPTETRATVALATLATLHDELSATPVLKPIPRTFSEGDADARAIIVQWAVRECLSATKERPDSPAPPRPDPSRLSVERAEAFLVLLENEMKSISTPKDVDLVSLADSRQRGEESGRLAGTAGQPEVCPARTLQEAVEWYLVPVDATLKAADDGVRVKDGESVIVKLSMLPPKWGIDLFMYRFLAFQDWLTSPPQGAVVDPSVNAQLISHAANYPKTIRPLICYDGPPVLRTLSMPRHAIDELRLDAKCMRTLCADPRARDEFDPHAGSRRVQDTRVILRARSEGPLVHGTEMEVLTDAQYNVLECLIRSGEKGLSKDMLTLKSGHADAVNVLKKLAASHELWTKAIPLPGIPGRGYRVLNGELALKKP